MLLNALESGYGDRTIVLLHGLMGSAESWWRIAPLLAGQDYRVIALDLPGHGHSPRDAEGNVESAAAAVVETLQQLSPGQHITAIGHSYGGTVLAAAADRLPLERAVYADTTCAFTGGADRQALAAQYAEGRERRRDPAWLMASRPYYSARDAAVEAHAADRFDPVTAASISSGDDVAYLPAPGSILVRAVPSSYVTDDDARRFAAQGVDVRSVAGAAHTIWYSHFDEFVASLPEVFQV
ncbi:alpha/beta fold hydrolase [Microbacterium sp. A196]|uniref:alpha/beta fold hydrolase n=1 Tax=Microbacterium sp. A196 TaxID=3457320 RepID=UPI003FD29D15